MYKVYQQIKAPETAKPPEDYSLAGAFQGFGLGPVGGVMVPGLSGFGRGPSDRSPAERWASVSRSPGLYGGAEFQPPPPPPELDERGYEKGFDTDEFGYYKIQVGHTCRPFVC